MIEMLLLAMILAKVVQNGVVDIAFAVRGKPSPRLAPRRAKRAEGAAYSYFSDLWNDTWDDARVKHSARRASRQDPAVSGKPRGAATVFFGGLFEDGRRRARRSWDGAWERADEKRRERATRPRPGQETVPGEVVPNAQGEDRPQDGDGPEPRVVPDEDGRTDLRFGDDPTDPTGTKQCPECRGAVVVEGEVCPSCLLRQQQRNEHWDQQDEGDGYEQYLGQRAPADPNEFIPVADMTEDQFARYQQDHPTQEGPTMTTTIPTDTEVTGLDPAITYCDTTVQACTAMQHSLEHTEAAIAAGGVTGVGSQAFAQAKELFGQIATIMQGAGQEFVAHKAIQEAYDANPGAGTREFVTGGR